MGVMVQRQKTHFLLRIASNPVLEICNLTKSGGIFALASPTQKFWGDLSPSPPVIYAHGLERQATIADVITVR